MTDQVSNVVHTLTMKMADALPSTERDILKNTNNSWTYPKDLDPSQAPYAHIYGEGVTGAMKAKDDAKAEEEK